MKYLMNIKSCFVKNRLRFLSFISLSGSSFMTYAADSPFTKGASVLKSDIIAVSQPIAGIILIGMAIVCACGILHWKWFAGFLVGVAIIFGGDQVIDWMKGLFA